MHTQSQGYSTIPSLFIAIPCKTTSDPGSHVPPPTGKTYNSCVQYDASSAQ